MVAALLLAVVAGEVALFVTAWRQPAVAFWAGPAAPARQAAGLLAAAALLAGLLLPVKQAHWPGLLAGPRAAWLGGGLFAVLLAVHSATAAAEPGAEVRAHAVYVLLLLALALPLLFGGRRTRCDSDG